MGFDPNDGTFRPLQDTAALEKFHKEVPKGTVFTEGETVSVNGVDFYIKEVGHSRLILKPKLEPK